eukprot:2691753-Amphidinium_carterae.1
MVMQTHATRLRSSTAHKGAKQGAKNRNGQPNEQNKSKLTNNQQRSQINGLLTHLNDQKRKNPGTETLRRKRSCGRGSMWIVHFAP